MENITILLFIIINIISGQVIITGPPELVAYFKNSNLTTSSSYFGRIPYGMTIHGSLFYDKKSKDGCELANLKSFDSSVPSILLVDRGNCTFVHKAILAESIGARAVVIINNNDFNVSNLIMRDDGNGKDVGIPALMINKEDGKILKEFFMNYSIINPDIEIHFDIQQKRRAKIDLFYSSDDLRIYNLLKHFDEYQKLFDHKDRFTPHLVYWENYASDEDNDNEVDNCFESGKFCAWNSLNATDGRTVILEGLRQKCIYQNTKSKQSEKYFDYMITFNKECLEVEPIQFNEKCSVSVMKSLGIDTTTIESCINQSFKSNSRTDFKAKNILLNGDKDRIKTYGIEVFPAILVNGRTFTSSWTGANLLEAICSGVMEKPDVCIEGFKKERIQGLSSFGIFLIVLIIVSVNLMIYILCKNIISKKVRDQLQTTELDSRISAIVSDYMSLKEQR